MVTLSRIFGLTRRVKDDLRRRDAVRRFRSALESSPPVSVPRVGGEAEIHTLFGHAAVLEAIATMKSLYRFLPEALPLVMHEDGTLTERDEALINRHLPGAKIVRRSVADFEIESEFARLDLQRCRELRRIFPLAIKLFDIPYFGVGHTLLYIDTDILFFRPPDELLNALATPAERWVDRYNDDIHTNYAWPAETIQECVGVPAPDRMNSGLYCMRRDTKESLQWDFFESCLASLPAAARFHYVEQTLLALDFEKRGAAPLPPEYDVCFRHTWRDHYDTWLRRAKSGHEVVTQHYCGGRAQRLHFYDHFARFVSPHL